MAYQALYRQWRPKTFSQMVGQEAIITTLRRQVQSGRIAHAYLLSGTRGTGKTSTAKIFAQAVNCLTPQEGDPCGTCANCLALANNNSLDIEEIDAASNNGVDEIRSLRERIQYPPQNGKYRVFIIDEVHMLSPSAFNALLKTLEEPPAHAILILATTEPQRLPSTILSRCQRFDFKRIPAAAIALRLREAAQDAQVAFQEEALMAIARAADGAMRDALSLLDLCMAAQGEITLDAVEEAAGTAGRAFLSAMTHALAQGDVAGALTQIEHGMRDGRDAAVLARDVATHIRALMVAGALGARAAADVLEIAQDEADALFAQAQTFGHERSLRALDLFSRVEPEMRWAAHPRTLLELAAVKACRPEEEADLSALLARIESLEATIAGGLVPIQPPRVAPPPADAPAPAAPTPTAPPAQATPPTPPTSAQKGGPSLTAPSIWKAALADLKKSNIGLFSGLRMGALHGIQDGIATVTFSPENGIFMQTLQLEANTAALAQALSKAAHTDIQVRAQLSSTTAHIPASAAQNTTLLEDVSALFGRENVQIVGEDE